MVLENTNGVGRSIQVIRCQADENGYEGLTATASGSITLLNNSTFHSNGYGGGFFGANLYTVAGNITITGMSVDSPTDFSYNSGYGLNIFANGNVSLNKVQANENIGPMGIYIDNMSIPGRSVSLTSSFIIGNWNHGLEVFSKGSITLNTVDASKNGGYGVYLDNCIEDLVITGQCNGSGNVTITAPKNYTNWFSYNGYDGLLVLSKGNISLTNVSAEYNY